MTRAPLLVSTLFASLALGGCAVSSEGDAPGRVDGPAAAAVDPELQFHDARYQSGDVLVRGDELRGLVTKGRADDESGRPDVYPYEPTLVLGCSFAFAGRIHPPNDGAASWAEIVATDGQAQVAGTARLVADLPGRREIVVQLDGDFPACREVGRYHRLQTERPLPETTIEGWAAVRTATRLFQNMKLDTADRLEAGRIVGVLPKASSPHIKQTSLVQARVEGVGWRGSSRAGYVELAAIAKPWELP